MSRPRSLPAGLKPYASRMSPGSAFGVVREYNGKKTPPHNGCDFPTPVGIPLEATISGKVSLVGGSRTHIWGYYLHIICDCPLKHVVEYHILRDPPVFRIGQRITAGQIIGHTGNSGSLNGKGYNAHHHHGVSESGKYFNPLAIGWPSATNTATPIETEEDDMYDTDDRKRDAAAKAAIDLIFEWIRGDGPDAAGTLIHQIKNDTSETVQGIRDLNVPDTRMRLGDLKNKLNLLLARDSSVSDAVAGFDDDELKAIAVTVNDERDRRERERLGA